MDKGKMFSIIVPVYNGQEFLSECIDSILLQTWSDFELIIVNDGSSDNSWSIIESYSKKDKRVQGYTILNGGVSNARNYGIKQAVGKYITFVDCDDLIEKTALEAFQKKIRDYEYDVIFGSQVIFEESRNHIVQSYSLKKEVFSQDSSRDSILKMCFFREIHNAVWGNAYKREIIINKCIEFNCDYSMNEDGDWLYRMILNADTFEMVNLITYYQRRDPRASNYHKLGRKYAESSISVNRYWYDYFNLEYKGASGEIIRDRIANSYLFSAFRIASIKGKDCEEIVKIFLSRKDILCSVTGYKNKYLFMVLKNFGFNAFVTILNLLIRISNRKN